MKKYFVFLLSIGIISGCTDDESGETSSEDCVWQDSVVRIFDKSNEIPCTYTDVYEFNDELFTICHCCICRKIESVRSCDGTNICIDVNGCTSDFLDKAEYQYSFE